VTDNAAGIGDLSGNGQPEMIVIFGMHFLHFATHPDGAITHEGVHLPHLWWNNAYPWRGVVTGDFDGDGKDNFVLASSTRMQLYKMEAGTPVFQDTIPWNLTYHRRFSLAVGDMTGNGLPDLVAVHSIWSFNYEAELTIYPVEGGVFLDPIRFPFSRLGNRSVVVGDIDNDGQMEAVVFVGQAYSVEPHYRVLKRTGPGIFDFGDWRIGGPATHFADVNGNGLLDGVMHVSGSGGAYSDPLENSTPAAFYVCLNDGQGGFGPAVSFPSLGSGSFAGVTDFDGDGDPDLVGGRSVLLNTMRAGMPRCDSLPNSTGAAAELRAEGSASVMRNDMVLVASSLPPQTPALMFFGYHMTEQPFADGMLCVASPYFRFPVSQSDAQGTLHTPIQFGVPPMYGSFVNTLIDFQTWFRDPAAGGAGSNLSNGLHVLFQP
jgi:hypothetical protein